MASPWDDLIEVPGTTVDTGGGPSSPWDDLIESPPDKNARPGKTAPNVPLIKGMSSSNTNLPPLWRMPWLESMLGKAENSPSAPTMARQIAKGIPVLGAAVPQNEEMTEMEKQWPGATTAANVSGGVLSTAGPIGGISHATRLNSLPTQMAAHGLFGGGVNVADTFVRDPSSSMDKLAWEGGKGAALHSLGPLLSKMLSPGKTDEKILSKLTRQEHQEMLAGERVLKAERLADGKLKYTRKEAQDLARKQWAEAVRGGGEHKTEGAVRRMLNKAADADDIYKILMRTGGMGVASSFFAHPMLAGAIGVGAGALPHIPRAAAKYVNNSVFQNPGTSDILKILLETANRGTSEPALGNLQVP